MLGNALSISGSTRVALNVVVALSKQDSVDARGASGVAKTDGVIVAADTAESK